jgi:2-methylisocitrate lyase-like PEP mutase family enzyme
MATGLVHAPGCFDALSATVVEQAGFRAAYLSGFALSAASLGAPDLGLIGLDDVTSVLRRITACVAIPVIADIDTGFGGPLSVRRTVREVETAGAAAVQIEDQVAPKRCGHFEDKRIVALDEAVERVAVAVEARRTADTVVIARTDAIAVAGIGTAVDRAGE